MQDETPNLAPADEAPARRPWVAPTLERLDTEDTQITLSGIGSDGILFS